MKLTPEEIEYIKDMLETEIEAGAFGYVEYQTSDVSNQFAIELLKKIMEAGY